MNEENPKFFITGFKFKGLEFGGSNNGSNGNNGIHNKDEFKSKYDSLLKEHTKLRRELLKHKIINLKYSLDSFQKHIYSLDHYMHNSYETKNEESIDLNYVIINKLKKQYYMFEDTDNKYLQDNLDISYTKPIESIKDLIQFSKHLQIQKKIHTTTINQHYPNINVDEVIDICSSLEKLESMIGMDGLKQSIFEQIIFYLQKLDTKNKDYLHTCIYGPPGTGKTEIANIIGEIFSKLNILTNNVFKKATRADLVGEYLGQTAIKVRNLVKSCLGGVLFIDEAYSLGNDKRDSFSKEAFDTLNELLSYHNNDLMVIVAGYKDEMKKYFFDSNPGLESRFTWIYDIQKYSGYELSNIFVKKIQDNEWRLDEELLLENEYISKWFETNKEYFVSYGRDVEVLFSKVKICHSKRLMNSICNSKNLNHIKKTIDREDLENGFKLFKNNKLDVHDESKQIREYLKNSIYI